MTQETENDTRKYESKKESYDDNRKMIESYLNLCSGNYFILSESGLHFCVKDLHDNTIFSLEIIHGRIMADGNDCIDNMKSAHDNDPEILDSIQKFEQEWYIPYNDCKSFEACNSKKINRTYCLKVRTVNDKRKSN